MSNKLLFTNVVITLLSQLGTASDVLKHVPGIIAKDDQYEVFGKGTPIIYINGRKMRSNRELEQLKSTDIKHIELITNPGAKYDATVGAIVKIKTIRKAGDGFSIDTWGRWQQSRKDKEAASLDLNYRHDGLDVFASLWARVMGTGTLVHSLGSMNLSPMIPEWFVLPILWKTHGTGVNHRVFCKESL